ncbi:MAG: thioesterase [Oscillospiraceae bacterium]|nr:thioesterase [Oscillospiraceae bacterium]
MLEDFKQILTQTSYSRQEELTFWDCDREKQVRVAALLSKMAAFAGYHYDALGLTHELLYAQGTVFLLSRVALRIHAVPHARDVLTITTWENGARGAQVQRVFEMWDQTGRLCVSAKSDWILMDPQTRRMLRPSAFTLRPLGKCPKEIDCPEPGKILLPKEGLTELGQRQILWSDLDGNGHLFSGNYGDIIWDHLPADLQPRVPAEFSINYSREAKFGETLRLLGCREGGTFRMEGIGPGGTCFTALCSFGGEK